MWHSFYPAGVFGSLFYIVMIVLWIWALYDILTSSFSGNKKIIWVLVVIFLPILGTILYFLIGRSQKSLL